MLVVEVEDVGEGDVVRADDKGERVDALLSVVSGGGVRGDGGVDGAANMYHIHEKSPLSNSSVKFKPEERSSSSVQSQEKFDDHSIISVTLALVTICSSSAVLLFEVVWIISVMVVLISSGVNSSSSS